YEVKNPGFTAPAVLWADSAAYEVKNPGFTAPAVPWADSAAYEVKNPGYAGDAKRARRVTGPTVFALAPATPESHPA
ncbi:MAG: hypothetical protein WBN71_01240, partial [Acidimicrobiia bacterium]